MKIHIRTTIFLFLLFFSLCIFFSHKEILALPSPDPASTRENSNPSEEDSIENEEEAFSDTAAPIISCTVLTEGHSIGSDICYTENISLLVTVKDSEEGEESGLFSVSYELYQNDLQTDPVRTETVSVSPGERELTFPVEIAADADTEEKFFVAVTASDLAGNTLEKEAVFEGWIDRSGPKVTVTYDNNDASSVGFLKEDHAYFQQDRQAEILLQDRHFSPEDSSLTQIIVNDSLISVQWKKTAEDIWSAQILFSEEAEYSLQFSFKDLLGNQASIAYKDRAGKAALCPLSFTIDKTPPVLQIFYDNNSVINEMYFHKSRTATIHIYEKNFDPVGFQMTGSKATEKGTQELSPSFTWKAEEEGHYSSSVTFSEEGIYRLSVSLCDAAGNKNQQTHWQSESGEISMAPLSFVIDNTPPSALLKVETEEQDYQWTSFDAGDERILFCQQNPVSQFTAEDALSSVSQISYALSPLSLTSEKELTHLTWSEHLPEIQENTSCYLYVKACDQAENVCYRRSCLLIRDTLPPEEAVFSIKTQASSYGFYHTDIDLTLSVSENTSQNGWAGLEEVSYQLLKNNEPVQQGILFQNPHTEVNTDTIQSSESFSTDLTIPAESGNSDSLLLSVISVDHAGNQSSTDLPLKIDTIRPKIQITYTEDQPSHKIYYAEDRTAIITVEENNFDPSLFVCSVQNETEEEIPLLSDWQEEKKGDSIFHTAKLHFQKDGAYRLSVSCKDMAENQNADITYEGGNETYFILDKTAPVISMSYDNNQNSHEIYFSSSRIAEIRITEANFTASDVALEIEGSNGDLSLEKPAITWSSSGNIHIGRIDFREDGEYELSLSLQDPAGNTNDGISFENAVAPQHFIIDSEKPQLSITGIQDQSAYADQVSAELIFSDAYPDTHTFTLQRTSLSQTEDVTSQFLQKNIMLSDHTGTAVFDAFGKTKENDGIYFLQCDIRDLAGNHTSKNVIFTVNRFGSVYVYGNYLRQIQRDENEISYLTGLEQDLVLYEYNPSPILEDSLQVHLTHDGAIQNVLPSLFEKEESSGSNADNHWYCGKYSIKKENFRKDGIYQLSLSSEDAAGNQQESALSEEGNIIFGIDTTPPQLPSINGLETDFFNQTLHTVSFTAADSMGLAKIQVYVDDHLITNIDYERISRTSDRSRCLGSFTISESKDQQHIRLILTDQAGNILDTDEKNSRGSYLFSPAYSFCRDILVSTDYYIQKFASKADLTPLFFILPLGLVLFFLLLIIFYNTGNQNR